MRKLTLALAVLVFAALGAGTAFGVSGAATATTVKVKVKLVEFKILPAVKSAKTGKVTFVVTNAGKINHEFVVIKTSIAAGKLPVQDNEASEKGAVGKIGDLAAGKTKRVTLTLKPGKYVFICNLPGHYKAGQYAAFRVL